MNEEKYIIGVFGFIASVFMFLFAYYIVGMGSAWSTAIGMLFIGMTLIFMVV
jgi:hypothetical protein